VLAKRLFTLVNAAAAEATATAYGEMYMRSSSILPDEAIRPDYQGRMQSHYPFHPTFLRFLNSKLATVETFQGTRGVLRLLALVVRKIWTRRDPFPMVHTAHVDLRDARILDEILGRTRSGDLRTVVDTDIGGPDTAMLAIGRSYAEIADDDNPHPSGLCLHELAWRTVFLHSLVGRAEGFGGNIFGITERDALFETAFPGLTPPQVEAALREIQNSASYLRFDRDHSRYFASLDPSINRALSDIRRGLRDEQVKELLAGTARKIVASDNGLFKVVTDIAAPEHIPDNTGRPVLGVVSLEVDSVDPTAIVETKGPHQARLHQNIVLLLAPETVRLDRDASSEERDRKAQEARNRVADLARIVLARRILKKKPEDYGIRSEQLVRDNFDADTGERELALQTAVTGLYRFLCFASASTGAVIRKEINPAAGEGGAAVLEAISRLLKGDGEMIFSDHAMTNEVLIALAQRFFDTSGAPALTKLRDGFLCNRHWPVLEKPELFDQIVREGVSKGHWCLFDMGGPDRVRPERFFSRETSEVPFDADLNAAGWAVVSPQGARQRGWGAAARVEVSTVVPWVTAAINDSGAATAKAIAEKVIEKHGQLPASIVYQVIDRVVQDSRAVAFIGDLAQASKPDRLFHGSSAIFHRVAEGDVVMTPSEAATRGWIAKPEIGYRLTGTDACQRLLPMLGRLGSLYNNGATSTVSVLDIAELDVEGGGRLRIAVQDASPAAMRRLGELFEVLGDVGQWGTDTIVDFEVAEPDENCRLIKALKEGVQ
jgi:hypothetical protein